MGPGLVYRLVIFMLFLGASISGYMMIWSLLADIVDYDEYKTNTYKYPADQNHHSTMGSD